MDGEAPFLIDHRFGVAGRRAAGADSSVAAFLSATVKKPNRSAILWRGRVKTPGPQGSAGAGDKFINSNLDQGLKDKGIKTVIVIGTSAQVAVAGTALGAAERSFHRMAAQPSGLMTE